MKTHLDEVTSRTPWNKGRLIGQKTPLKLKEIWTIRIRFQLAAKTPELALFNLAIDSKLRGCDFVNRRVCDITQGKSIPPRAMILQRKTHRPVQFEITEQTRQSFAAWIEKAHVGSGEYFLPSRISQIAAPVHAPIGTHRNDLGRIDRIGFNSLWHARHAANQSDTDLLPYQEPVRRPIASGPHQAGGAVRYLGIAVDDALDIAQQTKV